MPGRAGCDPAAFRDGAGLCCASPSACPEPGIAQGEGVGSFAQHIFEVLRGKREPLEQVPAAVHSLHTRIVPSTFAGRWESIHPCSWPLPRNAQVSPSPGICRGGNPADLRAPSAPEGASPGAHAPHHERLGCASGRSGRDNADTLAGKAI